MSSCWRHSGTKVMNAHRLFISHYPLLIIAIAVVVVIMSCYERLTYHRYQSVSTTWAVTDTLHFIPEDIDYKGNYRVSVGVRVDDRFGYRNLWLVVEQRTLNGNHSRHRDTVDIILADSRGGWLTEGVALHTAEEEVGTTHLEQDERYEFLVYHIMNDQQLAGINDVGLLLSPN